MSKVYSYREIAEMLLQVIDHEGKSNIGEFMVTGIDDVEYIGQGIHSIYVERDTLLHVAGKLGE